jgi:hypothetical protein
MSGLSQTATWLTDGTMSALPRIAEVSRAIPSGTQAGVAVLFHAKHIAVKNAVLEIVR